MGLAGTSGAKTGSTSLHWRRLPRRRNCAAITLGQADWLRRATAQEPLREDLQRDLVRATAVAGDPVAAMSAYREFRELLWREDLDFTGCRDDRALPVTPR